jgi:predicted DCC family thiol-disulfide oxidoreductase YuxK
LAGIVAVGAVGLLVLLIVAAMLFGKRWMLQPQPAQRPIVFFDGVCNLCNAAVDFIIRHDPGSVFLFAPLQGQTALDRLGPQGAAAPDTIVLLDADGQWLRSDAAVRIARGLRGPWRLLAVLRWLPRPLRDAVYRLIAGKRYAWFGRKQSCRLPTPAERARFLP